MGTDINMNGILERHSFKMFEIIGREIFICFLGTGCQWSVNNSMGVIINDPSCQ